jgi:hypothetical protein
MSGKIVSQSHLQERAWFLKNIGSKAYSPPSLPHITPFDNHLFGNICIISNSKLNDPKTKKKIAESTRVCLDGEMISARITLFGLIVENSVRLVISREIWEKW